jgi:hypothetical protein
MRTKRSLLAAVVLLVGCLYLIWPVSSKRAGSLTVSFVGLTNDVSGKTLAEFRVSNRFSRRVGFGVCEVQIFQTNGWPDGSRVEGGAAWRTVSAGRERAFFVPIPPSGNDKWRVPIMYQEDLSLVDNLRFRTDLLVWGAMHWRPGQPPPVRNGGDGFHKTRFAFGPEMSGASSATANSAQGNTAAR